eukprot:TRINITY_DN13657_c1_g1_i1.p1 TRINITY_DN13657_c1_g1~~TRINITY_DN13657_c1_g1_i1.p1  ORF type:complete len:242 (+),score=-18.92 TRINITY_DN13657_c1_g1_i1:524-1249(+)
MQLFPSLKSTFKFIIFIKNYKLSIKRQIHKIKKTYRIVKSLNCNVIFNFVNFQYYNDSKNLNSCKIKLIHQYYTTLLVQHTQQIFTTIIIQQIHNKILKCINKNKIRLTRSGEVQGNMFTPPPTNGGVRGQVKGHSYLMYNETYNVYLYDLFFIQHECTTPIYQMKIKLVMFQIIPEIPNARNLCINTYNLYNKIIHTCELDVFLKHLKQTIQQQPQACTKILPQKYSDNSIIFHSLFSSS